MSNEAAPVLLDYLNKSYASLKRRLTQVLGNADLASDALHDTWVRVKDRDDRRPIAQPAAYLMRVATNIAAVIQRRQRRSLSGDDVDALLEEMVDPAPSPQRMAEARSDLNALTQIMASCLNAVGSFWCWCTGTTWRKRTSPTAWAFRCVRWSTSCGVRTMS